ncbi:hypothetical protein ACLSY0_07955 [Avibacterium avium]|uniref:hypothetical protein n=1 Tax=Avibacterium avium TaxID=751 RepID=UPI003BF8F45F
MKKAFLLCVAVLLSLSGCVKVGEGRYEITLRSIWEQLQQWKYEYDFDDDMKKLSQGVTLDKNIDLPTLKGLFQQYEALNKVKNTAKYRSCQKSVQAANKKGDALRHFYSNNQAIINIYESNQALGNLFMGIAALRCTGDIICRTQLSHDISRVGAKQVFNSVKSVSDSASEGMAKMELEEKGYTLKQARNAMSKYKQLKQQASAAYQKTESCRNYMISQEYNLKEIVSDYAKQCVGNNWFNMKTKDGMTYACSEFLSKGMYKKYLK